MTKLYLTHNNGYDSVVLERDGEFFGQTIGDVGQVKDAMLTGDDQDLDNWTGVYEEEAKNAEFWGEVFATNDGETFTVTDEGLMENRMRFYRLAA